MPRKPRFFVEGVPVHIVQRGHNRDPVFFEDSDFSAYLQWAVEASERYGCSIHAYCLMTNHIHLLATPEQKDGITRMMQYIGRYYVPYINQKYGLSGSIWEGRYKCSLVSADEYLFSCMRYIELNPVAADIARHASHYRWSSYRCNAQGKFDPLVKPRDEYSRLVRSAEGLDSYEALFKAHQDELEEEAARLESASQTGTPLGGERFKEQIEKTLKMKTGQARRGRPAGFSPVKNVAEEQLSIKGL